MKGLGDNRSRHLSENLDSPQDSLYAPQDRNPYLLSPTDSFTMDPRFPAQNTVHSDCLLPLNNQISNSSTFPRIHYNSHFEVPDDNPFPSHAQATKINRLPANLLDQFEKQLPIHRDGFSTLQFQRSDAKHRSESPGRIRHLVHSVQKLFAKSQSLEGPTKGNVNGKKGADDAKQNRRSKSKDRAKTSEPKRRTRSNISGWWSSDDNLDSDTCSYRNPMGLMTLGRQPDHSQPKYFMHAYNTISEHMLKSSKSNNDLKVTPCTNIPINNDSNYIKRGSWSTLTLSHAREVCQKASATIDKALLKSKSCHQDLAYHYLQDVPACPVSPALPSFPGALVPHGEWNNTLSRDKDSEIPCRRMRSGSYIKAMGDDDSEDSETSPKPSPKTAARRQSYLKATQQSLSEQSTTQRSLDRLDSVEILLPPKFPTWEEEYNQISDSANESSCINQIFGPPSLIPQIFTHGEQAPEPELGEQYEPVCDSTYSEAESAAAEVLDLPLPSYFRSRSHSYLRAIQAGCSQEDDTGSVRSISPPPTGSLSGSRTLPTNSTKPVLPFSQARWHEGIPGPCQSGHCGFPLYQSSTNSFHAVGSSCLVAYKKTPPPVPPRTTSKPFISVTVQSSTESAQDTYLDSQDHKSEVTSQSGLSNSSDSLDSTRTPSVTRGSIVTPARDTPELPQKNATLKSDKGTLTNEEPKVENIPKRKLSSIGIQVDCLQPVAKEEPPPPATKFQSIGVQVEDEWRNSHSRSMSSKQDTDSDTQEPNNSSCKSSERSLAECPQHNSSVGVDASTTQPAKPSQIKRNLSYGENNDPALEPSSLPPPDPWLESSSTSPSEPAQPGPCRQDGFWFLKLLQAETERLEGWCCQMDQETKKNNLSEEVLGKVLSAVGSAQLLMSQKFQQFRGLCEQNLNPNANPRPTAQDLAGFWDLLQLSIEDISMKFDELYHLKANRWHLAETPKRKEEKKPPPPVPKKPAKSKSQLSRDKGSDSDKQRQEARKRLMAAKRAASVRQNSATESADSIEIYVPEAQTRL
ncbi:disks large-associated protein 4 isoform X1 [Vidua chalybeata]|uniref:disks large-associated protein 4 isoform X1 n=1 Tax=Vidua chalybeata TaxID=81927 RepID=UPI0023A80849|nr:disks large-associated protein 4 isoform X1 [Vidua chalybeata]XP_053814307.1 disks large-associated protein 4 isoform X1 [Vidua chalybeata]